MECKQRGGTRLIAQAKTMKRKSSTDTMGSSASSAEAHYTHRITPVGSPRSDGMNEEKAKLGESRIQLGVASNMLNLANETLPKHQKHYVSPPCRPRDPRAEARPPLSMVTTRRRRPLLRVV